MKLIVSFDQVANDLRSRVGGKFFALAEMAGHGIAVPEAVCVTTDAYDEYVSATALRERILMELNRKDFARMRWEEMWDSALRIRNMFLNTAIPDALAAQLRDAMAGKFTDAPVVVRSSAPGEDSARASFAGLHESYVNVRGLDEIIKHIKLVWASLWSDAALLYRQELGLNVEASTMAVVVQEIRVGRCSGVAFAQNPNDPAQAVIEAVHGLNQGLVDGTVEPDRWILDRVTGKILSHAHAERQQAVMPSDRGVELQALPSEKIASPPLTDDQVRRVFSLVRRTESIFRSPQDVEWTFHADALYALQSRPITSGASSADGDDKRSWQLSLRRSFDNLKALRAKIEDELIPAMIQQANELADIAVGPMSDAELADELQRRSDIHRQWVDVYWRDFIPFAHGVRLFGQVYNDAVEPADPYEFVDLLRGTKMASLERNQSLEDLARLLKRLDTIDAEHIEADGEVNDAIETFKKSLNAGQMLGAGPSTDEIIKLALAFGERGQNGQARNADPETTRTQFLSRFTGRQRLEAEELLDLARTSYQLRDDDNIYLGRIENQLQRAVIEAKTRLTNRGLSIPGHCEPQDIIRALTDPTFTPPTEVQVETTVADPGIHSRQLTGQPAGSGIVTAVARVILQPSDLFEFKAGEVLICDAIDPNMTFVVPPGLGDCRTTGRHADPWRDHRPRVWPAVVRNRRA